MGELMSEGVERTKKARGPADHSEGPLADSKT